MVYNKMETRSKDVQLIYMHVLYQLEYAMSSKVNSIYHCQILLEYCKKRTKFGMYKFTLATHRLHILHAALISCSVCTTHEVADTSACGVAFFRF